MVQLRDGFNLSVDYADVEDHLEEPIRQVVRHPRQVAIRQWQSALEESIDELKQGSGEIQILSCHLTLFNAVRSEFYSPVAPSIFVDRGFCPDRFVILFDDIFDMLRRLSVDDPDPWKAGIFSPSLGESMFLDRAARTLDLTRSEDLVAEERSYLRTEYRVQALTKLLAWRRAEIVQAELLAGQIDAEFLPYGVKHAVDGLVNACRLSSAASRTLYVSHPISQPRRETRKGDDWPGVVHECNRLPETLTRMSCIPIMPTAIDELRLEQSDSGLFDRAPLLSCRWPMQSSPTGLIHSDAISFSEAERSLLLPDAYDEMPETHRVAVAGLMRGLEASISAEVPFRDHLIVAHAKDLLVYRPLYGDDSTFSGGVEHEISHWEELANAAPGERHVAFIHTFDDVRSVLRAIEADSTRFGTWGQFFENDVRKQLLSKYTLHATAKEAWSIFRSQRPDDLLGNIPLSTDLVKALRAQSLVAATRHFAFTALTNLEDEQPYAGVFLAPTPAEIDVKLLKRVVRFFFDRGPADGFGLSMDQAIDGGLLAWGEELAKRLIPTERGA